MNSDTVIPSWLDKDFLANVLQQESSKQVNVLSFSAKPAVAAGNNYCCQVYRVSIEYETDKQPAHKSLIVKTPLQSGDAKDLIEEMGVVAKECLIYKELLPIIKKLTNKSIVPKDYYCTIPGTLILDDLKEQGYVMCDRLEQLDFDHCNNFMRVIAVLHATSLHIYEQKPELIEEVGKELIYSESAHPECKEYFFNGLDSFSSVIKEWEGFEHLGELIKSNLNILWEKGIEIHSGKKHLRVLNHGDVWTNNMLFKHDDAGKVISIKLIDLQICKFTSPANDITSFLTTSAREEVKLHRLPELYDTYVESFNSTMETIGCEERISIEQLLDELKFVKIFPLILLPCYVAIVLSGKDNVLNIDKILQAWKDPEGEGKEIIQKVFNHKHFKNVAKFTLKKLEEDGVFTSF